MSVAIVTGASRGLGEALAAGPGRTGWSVVIDARDPAGAGRGGATHPDRPAAAGRRSSPWPATSPTPSTGRAGRGGLALGGLDLLVNNASTLGPRHCLPSADYPLGELRVAFEVNVVAPLALVQDGAPAPVGLDPIPRSSTSPRTPRSRPTRAGAATASSKAALDHLSAVLAVEEPALTVWAVDPGDMRTAMHQDAFPGEDISDRPEPDAVVPAFLAPHRRATPERAATAPPTCWPHLERRSTGMSRRSRRRRRHVWPDCTRSRFELPPELEAAAPPEARGMTRDAVRMMVATAHDGAIVHTHFSELPRFLDEGDLVVVNTSGTLAAELAGADTDGPGRPGPPVDPAARRSVDRRAAPPGPTPSSRPRAGEQIDLPAGGRVDAPHALLASTRGGACACGWPASTRPSRCTPTWPCTASPSATATCGAAGRSRCTRTCTPPSRARPRCRAPGGPSPPRC